MTDSPAAPREPSEAAITALRDCIHADDAYEERDEHKPDEFAKAGDEWVRARAFAELVAFGDLSRHTKRLRTLGISVGQIEAAEAAYAAERASRPSAPASAPPREPSEEFAERVAVHLMAIIKENRHETPLFICDHDILNAWLRASAEAASPAPPAEPSGVRPPTPEEP